MSSAAAHLSLALQRAQSLGVPDDELSDLQAKADAQRAVAEAPLRLAREGRSATFLFLDASKLRADDELLHMPSMRELSARRADWLIPREIRLRDVCNGMLRDAHLAVSHRWEDPVSAMRRLLLNSPAIPSGAARAGCESCVPALESHRVAEPR